MGTTNATNQEAWQKKAERLQQRRWQKLHSLGY